MSSNHDYYDILGVSPSAETADIKRAFRELAKQHHPDVNPDDAGASEAKFKLIVEAYGVLSKPDSRAEYDAEWRYVFGPSGGARAAGRHAAAAGVRARPGAGPVDGSYFDADAWNRAHYGPTDHDRAKQAFQDMTDAERRGWTGQWEDPRKGFRQNYERRRMAQAGAEALKKAQQAQRMAHKAGPVGGKYGPVVTLGVIAVGLVVFDQVTRRMHSHEYASATATAPGTVAGRRAGAGAGAGSHR